MIKIFALTLIFTMTNAILYSVMSPCSDAEIGVFGALTMLGIIGCIVSFFVAMCYTWKERFPESEEQEEDVDH